MGQRQTLCESFGGSPLKINSPDNAKRYFRALCPRRLSRRIYKISSISMESFVCMPSVCDGQEHKHLHTLEGGDLSVRSWIKCLLWPSPALLNLAVVSLYRPDFGMDFIRTAILSLKNSLACNSGWVGFAAAKACSLELFIFSRSQFGFECCTFKELFVTSDAPHLHILDPTVFDGSKCQRLESPTLLLSIHSCIYYILFRIILGLDRQAVSTLQAVLHVRHCLDLVYQHLGLTSD